MDPMHVTRRRMPGQVVGSLVAIVFGVVFVVVNSGGLPSPWPLVSRIAAAVVAVGLLVGLRGVTARPDEGKGFTDRRYWLVVLAEAVALFGGLALINGVWRHSELAVAWIAFVVGVHFFGLAVVFRLRRFHALGAVLTVLGLAGFALGAAGASAATIALVSGVLSGAALFATVAVSLRLTPPATAA